MSLWHTLQVQQKQWWTHDPRDNRSVRIHGDPIRRLLKESRWILPCTTSKFSKQCPIFLSNIYLYSHCSLEKDKKELNRQQDFTRGTTELIQKHNNINKRRWTGAKTRELKYMEHWWTEIAINNGDQTGNGIGWESDRNIVLEWTANLKLQVVGVMGRVIQKAGNRLIPSILRCAKSDTAPQSNQKAAIQSFRRMAINDEVQ